MDGNFFSIMPFGNSNFHVLTSVGHTPHDVSWDKIPHFKNNVSRSICEMHRAEGCIVCAQNLKSRWNEMCRLSRTFLKPNFAMKYKNSMFEMKAILKASEDDDSRPTIIRPISQL